MQKDRIFAKPMQSVGDFVFDERVVEVFPDMIARSVPGYSSVLAMTVELAEQFALPNTNVYDLGCSLGAATLPIAHRIPHDAVVYAVDSSPAMIAALKEKIAKSPAGCRIEVVQQDISQIEIHNASFVVMNFTMQFISPNARDALVCKIAEGMLPGGVFVLSEKISFDDESQQNLMTLLHHAFKKAHGYSDLEIAQKRSALEKTLLPETLQEHTRRLGNAGFSTISPWFQWFNFASFIAVKASD